MSKIELEILTELANLDYIFTWGYNNDTYEKDSRRQKFLRKLRAIIQNYIP